MRQASSCLSDGQLAALTDGLCGESSLRDLEGHLGRCDRCAGLTAAIVSRPGSADFHPSARPLILSPGMVLGGRYVVERFLGLGGMGEVHLARDRVLGEPVALKTLNASKAGSQRSFDLLKAEVALARRVTHPNVCRIFDCGVDEALDASAAVYFLTMEFLPGRTLRKALDSGDAFPPARAMRIWAQVVQGLAAAHRVGVVHRDLKPENIMLLGQGESERAVILDFGLATALTESRVGAEGQFVGTLRYAPPEQINGQAVTPASDVFAAALVMTEMLTGTLLRSPPRVPADLPVSSSLRRILERATQSDGARRFSDGVELARALETASAVSGPKLGRVTWWVLAAAFALASVLAFGQRGGRPASGQGMPTSQAARQVAPIPAEPTKPVDFAIPNSPRAHPVTRATRPRAPTRVPGRVMQADESPETKIQSNPQQPRDDLARDVTFGSVKAVARTPEAEAILPDPFIPDPFAPSRTR